MNAYWFLKGSSAVESIPVEPNELHLQQVQPTILKGGPPSQRKPFRGETYGHLLIPKLDAKIPIFYGSEEEQLKQGIGHVEGTALPGENHHTVLSGHRDTVFRHLGKIEKNDIFIVNTETGTFSYKVKKIRIVDKDNQTVMVPKPRATLSVITCYPFGFLGNAPKRFVVVADLISKEDS